MIGMHTVEGLSETAVVLAAALGCGLLFERFRQPAILGYILAGVFLGPYVCSLIHDETVVLFFANLGVLMVLFIVGIELDLSSFKGTLSLSLIATVLQLTFFIGLSFVLAHFFHWETSFSLFLGFIGALSSTAVAVNALQARGKMKTEEGRMTLGILISQDLAIIPMILVLREFDRAFQWHGFLFKILIALGSLCVFASIFSQKKRLNLFSPSKHVPETQDIAPLIGLALCFGFSTLSGWLGLSCAYGAFLAGLILGNSHGRGRMLQATVPIYNVLLMMFFLSVGLLLDLEFMWANKGTILCLLLSLTFLKTALNVAILRFLKKSWTHAFCVGTALSQLSEFGFVLTALAQELGLLSSFQHRLVLTVTALSLGISPLWLALVQRWRRV